jgi:hypothetical protein
MIPVDVIARDIHKSVISRMGVGGQVEEAGDGTRPAHYRNDHSRQANENRSRPHSGHASQRPTETAMRASDAS